jgi:hypothetical protein
METIKEPSKVEVYKDEGVSKGMLIMISFISLLLSISQGHFVQRKAEELLKRLSREEGRPSP